MKEYTHIRLEKEVKEKLKELIGNEESFNSYFKKLVTENE